MRISQIILVIAALAVVFLLYFFGKTVSKQPAVSAANNPPVAAANNNNNVAPASFPALLLKAKQRLPAAQINHLTELENSVVRGDVKEQQIKAYRQLGQLWDTLGYQALAAHYFGEAAKLENSEKSLTFAANLFLDQMQQEQDASVIRWEANEADTLLQKALILDPDNDSTKAALADVYVESGDVMKGVQQLLAITQKDSTNVAANLLLGRLSVRSGQYDKAIVHLQKVVNEQPNNAEALYFLAVSYRETGNDQEAIRYFKECKKYIHDPGFNREIDSLVNTMK